MKREIEWRGNESKIPTSQEKRSGEGNEQIERMKQKLELAEAWNSCIEAVPEVTCPYCFHVLPIRDVIDDKKWKMHVKDDLDPYVCLFEECESPGHLYSHSGQWMKHMRDHTLRWRCKSKTHGEFIASTKADYIQHMNTCHPGKFKDAQLAVLADRGALTGGPLFTACPLCGVDKTDRSMESHVVSHMRLLALKSLPATLDDADELDEAEEQHDSGDTSRAQSRSTIKRALEETGSLSPPVADEAWDESHEREDHVFGQSSPASEYRLLDHLPDPYSYDQDDPVLQPFIQRVLDNEGPTGNQNPNAENSEGQPSVRGIRMDPDCAICHGPASMACECEAKGLDIAVKQAEERMMMSIYKEIRGWVKVHAQDYMNQRARCSDSNCENGKDRQQNIPEQASGDEGQLEGPSIDVDLLETTEYYYGLVELTLPAEDEPAVRNPPLGKVPSKDWKPSGSWKPSESWPDVKFQERSAVNTSIIPSDTQDTNTDSKTSQTIKYPKN
ncbi:hypothetical protein NW766_008514 [Fusarium irregulare]|uniref:Oxidoreductase acuF-like C2H2 type zinc-finger domain-containing protein n=1 Tax=Fusarium irregulare TaxID=2494466 RepID=A0A9W8PJK1_9HYPO|nr:hypothetical protein NW766_008514 [Fusarium irregulare]